MRDRERERAIERKREMNVLCRSWNYFHDFRVDLCECHARWFQNAKNARNPLFAVCTESQWFYHHLKIHRKKNLFAQNSSLYARLVPVIDLLSVALISSQMPQANVLPPPQSPLFSMLHVFVYMLTKSRIFQFNCANKYVLNNFFHCFLAVLASHTVHIRNAYVV